LQLNVLDHSVPIREYTRAAVDHQIGDRRVQQERPQFFGKER
jgi:hypothetical protein